jgi:hypothetical protein
MARARFFSLNIIQTGSEVHPTPCPMDIGVLSPGVKRPGREAEHSPPISAEVNNAWMYKFIPPTRFHGAVIN